MVLLLVRTTERTFYGDGVVHSTDGWQPWSTSLLVLGLVALAASYWLYLRRDVPAVS